MTFAKEVSGDLIYIFVRGSWVIQLIAIMTVGSCMVMPSVSKMSTRSANIFDDILLAKARSVRQTMHDIALLCGSSLRGGSRYAFIKSSGLPSSNP